MTSDTSGAVEAAATYAHGTASGPPTGRRSRLRLNKVPEVTVYVWVIKVLCTTVGETAADLLNEKAGLGPTGVSLLMGALLAVVPAVVFVAWYRSERTLSIHSVDTLRRASVSWLAGLFTFALRTSAGDYLSQPTGDGGPGPGTVVTSALLVTVILGLVVFLAITRKDVTKPNEQELQAV
ncbi:hypothetical protein [Streptomyces sp. NPDC001492]